MPRKATTPTRRPRPERKPTTPPETKPDRVRPNRARFAAEYLIDSNGTRAAIAAGYAPKAAHVTASRLLRDAKVLALIEKGVKRQTAKAEVTADRILEEVDRLALADIGEVLDFSGDQVRLRRPNEMSENGRRLLASMKVKRSYQRDGTGGWEPVEVVEFKLSDKVAALRLAMQHRKMLTDKVELTGKGGRPLTPARVTVRLVKAAGVTRRA